MTSAATGSLDDFDGLLDWPRLQAWIAAQDCPGTGPVTAVTRLTGGSQNNIFLLERAGARMVLRRPPRHLRETSNEVIRREATVLRGLDGSAVPHPTCYAVCVDPDVIGSAFALLEHVDGFTPRGVLPGGYRDPAWRRRMAFAIVDAAAELAQVDPALAGVAELGRPGDWVGRQLVRWDRQLAGYQELAGYRGRGLAGVGAIGAWLAANRPAEYRLGIVHGDLQFANVMVAHDRPEIVALIDWELTSLGDPLLDLGWILTSWDEPGDPPGHLPYVEPFEGFPTRAELVGRYLDRTGRDPALVRWYFVLACYKLAILVEGTYARALSGLAAVDVGERLHRHAGWLMAKAAQLADGT